MSARRDNCPSSGVLGLCVLLSLAARGCKDNSSTGVKDAGAAAGTDDSGAQMAGGGETGGGTETSGGGETSGGDQTSGGTETSGGETTGGTQTGGAETSGGDQATGGETNGGDQATGGSMAAAGTSEGGTVSAGGIGEAGAESGGTAGGSAGEPAVGSCDEFSCPDLGTCSLQQEGDGCLRICAFTEEYSMMTADDVARLAALKCQIVQGSLRVSGNEIDTLDGLATIREVTGSFSVQTNDQPQIELSALRAVGEDLLFLGLTSAESIQLPSLESVGGRLTITENPSLTSVQLDSLESVTEQLVIGGNDNLLTLNELPSLENLGGFLVTANPKLPQCEVDAIAERVGVDCYPCSGNDTAAICN